MVASNATTKTALETDGWVNVIVGTYLVSSYSLDITAAGLTGVNKGMIVPTYDYDATGLSTDTVGNCWQIVSTTSVRRYVTDTGGNIFSIPYYAFTVVEYH